MYVLSILAYNRCSIQKWKGDGDAFQKNTGLAAVWGKYRVCGAVCGWYPNSFRNTASRKTYAIWFVPLIRIDGLNVNCKGGGIRIITFRITTRLHSKPNRCI